MCFLNFVKVVILLLLQGKAPNLRSDLRQVFYRHVQHKKNCSGEIIADEVRKCYYTVRLTARVCKQMKQLKQLQ